MRMKMYEVLNFLKVYPTLKNKQFKINILYKLSKCFEACEKEGQFYNEKLQEIIQKYCQTDDNGHPKYSEDKQNILIRPDCQEKCNKELTDLIQLDVIIDERYFLSIEELGNIELDMETFEKFKPFIKE